MTLTDLDSLAKGLSPVVAEAVALATAAVRAQVLELQGEVAKLHAELAKRDLQPIQGERGEPGPAGLDGKDADLDVVRGMIEAAVAALPAPEPGPQGERGEPGPAGLDGKDGRDGLDGKDGADGAPGRDGADGRDGMDGKDGAAGRDGVGLAGALISRDGNLVLTLSDGTTRDLGFVIGAKGEPGLDGKDGRDGVNGRDGFSLDDFDTELKADGRTLLLKFTAGDVQETHEIGFPAAIYRGVFKDKESYERGDMVTWAGSLWHCDADTTDRPGEGSASWTLAAKRGRDGKDGTKGEKGDPGRDGKDAKW